MDMTKRIALSTVILLFAGLHSYAYAQEVDVSSTCVKDKYFLLEAKLTQIRDEDRPSEKRILSTQYAALKKELCGNNENIADLKETLQKVKTSETAVKLANHLASLREQLACGKDRMTKLGYPGTSRLPEIVRKETDRFNGNSCAQYWQGQFSCVWRVTKTQTKENGAQESILPPTESDCPRLEAAVLKRATVAPLNKKSRLTDGTSQTVR